MELHKLLKEQLRQAKLCDSKLPPTVKKWQEFIESVNKNYCDTEQNQYLSAISIYEMINVNEKLEHAQHIAKIGYWDYEANGLFHWSQELYNIFHYDPSKTAPSYQEFLKLIHPQERQKFQNTMEKAIQPNKKFACELRIKTTNDNYKWYRLIAHKGKKEEQRSGIFIDVNKEKEAKDKINELNKKLLLTARQAGMSEIATSILHNVGNILNSSNVSINIILEGFSKPYFQKLFQIIAMLQENSNDLINYLTTDEKGKHIPEYIAKLSNVLINENKKLKLELNNIFQHLKDINEIVAMQHSISGMTGIVEKIFIPESIDTAIKMSLNSRQSKSILITKKYLANSFIHADKSKLLQILGNLVKNAIDAVIASPMEQTKQIEITTDESVDNINIIITDSGIGIPPENLIRIFSFGFTTKINGHGFGLHSCALSVKEMGGTLRAESKGLEQGSTFILTLPKKAAPGRQGANNG